MPHLTVEITPNLESVLDAEALLDRAHQALLVSGVFEGPDVKSRLLRLGQFRVGCGTSPEGFVHATLDLLSGRAEIVKRELAQAVVDAAMAQLPRGLGFPVQVSCDVRDMNRDCYAKAIHTD